MPLKVAARGLQQKPAVQQTNSGASLKRDFANDVVSALGRHAGLLPSLRSPPHFLLPGGRPELAALLQVLPLLQLLLPEVAAQHRVAVLVDAIDEVLAGHTDHTAPPVLQVAVIDEIPLLHRPSLQVHLH